MGAVQCHDFRSLKPQLPAQLNTCALPLTAHALLCITTDLTSSWVWKTVRWMPGCA